MNEELRSAHRGTRDVEGRAAVDQRGAASLVNQENRHKVAELSQLSSDMQSLMAATQIATLFLDGELRILRFTPQILDLFNLQPADRGRPLADFTHRLGYPDLRGDAQRVLERLETVEREVQDERQRWYLTQLRPYRTADHRLDGVVLTFVDITDRKLAELAVRESEERFRALVTASAQMVWTTDHTGRVVESSPSWEAFTGQSAAQQLGLGWLDALEPADRAAAAESWEAAVRAQSSWETEFRVRHHESATYRWTTVHAVPLRHGDGSLRGWVGMNTDITDQKLAAATRVHFQSLFESTPGLYLVLDPAQDQVVAASDAYLEATRTQREEITGRHFFDVFPGDDGSGDPGRVEKLRELLDRVKTEHRADVLALQLGAVRRHEGGGGEFEDRFWGIANAPVFGPHGELAYIIIHFEDLTPFVLEMRGQQREEEGHRLLQRRAEHMEADILLRAAELQRVNDQLRRLNESLESRVSARTREVHALAAKLALAEQEERRRISQVLHDDLQQMLYGIQMKLQAVRQGLTDGASDDLRRRLDQIGDWTRSAFETTRRLTVELSPPTLHGESLADSLNWLQAHMKEMYDLSVEVRASGDLPVVEHNLRRALFHIARELLFNVVKHAGTGQASLVLFVAGPDLVLQVTDRGRGFDASTMAGDGNGLGNVRERLQLIGGRMAIDAEAGVGTRVTVSVPATGAAAREAT
jgi:PAS domain S-box-containing protein